MNRKGFTLVELLAALAILGIIVTIGGVAISRTINNTKKKDYEVLVANIKIAAETYFQEYKYGGGGEYNSCISLKDLVDLGYLNYNKKDGNGKGVLINPLTDNNITNCKVQIGIIDYEIKIYSNSSANKTCPNTVSGCPTTANYIGEFED